MRNREKADEQLATPHYRSIEAIRATALICGAALSVTLLAGCNPSDGGRAGKIEEPTATALAPGLTGDRLYVMDTHDQALPFWVAKGVRGATLVHVDAHDDFRAIDNRRLEPLLDVIRSGDATAVAALADNEGTGGSYNLGDYIFAATRAGIVSEVVWVVPQHKSEESLDLLGAWKQWLLREGFSEEEVSRFELADGGGLTGKLHGVPVTIVTPDEFRAPTTSVLLDVDADFFPLYSATLSQTNPLGPTHDVMVKLLTSGLRVEYGTVAASVSGDYLDVKYKWLADVAAAALVQPSVLTSEAPPTAWGAMGEAMALEGVDEAVATDRWREAVQASPELAAGWYGLGTALLRSGESTSAVDSIGRAVSIDPLYAYGWLNLGTAMAVRGDSRALSFIDRAKGKVPDFYYRLRRADALYNLKRYAEAAGGYAGLSEDFDHPDIWMYLGDSYVALKNERAAEAAYLKGEASLSKVTFRTAADYPDSLPALGRMAEQRGAADTAIGYYELYLEVAPDGPDAAEIGRRLSRLKR